MDSPSRKRPGHHHGSGGRDEDHSARSSKRRRSFSSSPSPDHHRTRDARPGRSGEERRDDSRDDDRRRHRGDEHYKSRRHSKHRRSPRALGDEAEEEDRYHRRHRHARHNDRSLSPAARHHGSSRRRSPSPPSRRSRNPLPSQNESFDSNRGRHHGDAVDKPPPKERPNYQPTGILAADSNKVTIGSGHDKQDIVLKYHEPPEARKPPPSDAWRMFVFKGDDPDPLDTIPLSTRSCWLLGREKTVADVYVEHLSASKQHAILQFRFTQKTDEWGEKRGKVGLYLLDLESANGTMLNGKRIEAARYIECRNGDVIKIAESTREYVLVLPPR